MKNPSFVCKLLAISMSMVFVNSVSASHDSHYCHCDDKHHHSKHYTERYNGYGRVISARPIYQQIAIKMPRQACGLRTVREDNYRNRDNFAGALVGGLVGAAIGHELGNGRSTATAVGGLIGASIGHNVQSERRVSYQDDEVCRTHYRTEYEQRIIGYDVRYDYQGRIYQTRTDRHPGERILVAANLRPRHY